MAAIPMMFMIGGTLLQAYGSYQSGRAEEASYRSAQQAANYNATIQAQNATVARQQANAREEAQRRASRQMMGESRAKLSQAGMGLGGSYGKILAQDAANMEIDALNIRYEGELDARGLLAQAELSRYEGRVAGMNASSARRAGNLGAVSSLLAGASNVYSYGRRRSNKKGG